MAAPNTLASLLMKLYSPAEFTRFVRHHFGSELAMEYRKSSQSRRMFELVDQLEQRDLIDHEFFERLNSDRPEHSELIREIRHQILGDESVVGEPDQTEDLPAERLAWQERLRNAMKSAKVEEPVPSEPLLDAAAVLPHFDPLTLRPVSDTEKTSDETLVVLASVCDTRPDGRWALHFQPRQKAIARMWSENRIIEAIDVNQDVQAERHEDVREYTELLRVVANGKSLNPRQIERYETLLALDEIAEWFEGSGADFVDTDQLTAILQRWRQIEPLRKLIGAHFRGRKDELTRLQSHADPNSGEENPVLTISGVGGVGKSALLGKLLLGMDGAEGITYPWVYLDFDNPEFDPANPRQLMEEIARQLSLLYETSREREDQFIGLESIAAGDMALSFTLDLFQQARRQYSSEVLDSEDALVRMIEALDKAIGAFPFQPRLLIVLDTFEQVQRRGMRVVTVLRQFIDRLLDRLPYARLVVSGRAGAPSWSGAKAMVLKKLDAETADAVLEALRIEDSETRQKLIESFGTFPLSLRLAAEAFHSGKLDVADFEDLTANMQELHLQGQLYTRILAHIPDLRVRRLAHPGLVVRRVTPGVIRDVLSSICEINADDADEIFNKLPVHVSLFEPDEPAPGEQNALRHRQDVREMMLQLMVNDPDRTDEIRAIHDAAVLHYQDRGDAVSRGEELYHRLMRNDSLEDLDRLWSTDVSGRISSSWSEPLPERARTWLGIRLGHLTAGEQHLRTIDWEFQTAREAESHLMTGDPEGALNLLRSRDDRSRESPLYSLEAESLRQMGQLEETLETIDRSIETCRQSENRSELVKLHLIGCEVGLEIGNRGRVMDHGKRATKLSEMMKDRGSQIRALELMARASRRFGSVEENISLQNDLESAFVNADEAFLRTQPQTVRYVVQTIGMDSSPVLQKAAKTFGNYSQQDVIKMDAFQLQPMLARVNETDKGHQRLGKLASEVGLSQDKFDLVALAGNSIRYGRLGDTIVTILEEAGDQPEVRQQAVQMFEQTIR